MAIKLGTSGKLREAVELYEALLKECPNFEHGHANYDLAGCYEDLGEYTKAEQHYRVALSIDPPNPIFLGGLASFTFLHGDPQESLNLHLKMLRLNISPRGPKARNDLMGVIRKLADRVGVKVENLNIPPE